MELYYNPDFINNSGFEQRFLPTQTTDYLDFIWQKYFNTKPSEFQLQYLSRQQGKTLAILHLVILQVNGVFGGDMEYTLYTKSRDTAFNYVKTIQHIVNKMKDKKFIIETSTSSVVRFKNGGVINLEVINTVKNSVIMDW